MAKAERLITADYNGLSNKPIINANLLEIGFIPVVNTYYRHTGATNLSFTQGLIYKYDGTKFEEIGGGSAPIDLSKYIQADTLAGLLPNVQYALVHNSDNVFTLVEVEGGEGGTGWFTATTDEEVEALLINDNLGKFFMFIGTSEDYMNYALYQIVDNEGTLESALIYVSADDIESLLNDKQDVATLEQDVAALGFTKNAGTLTGITMNGSAVQVEGGVANLGTVITEHQSLDEYATEAWVNEQGFLTEHQSLDDYYTKSEVDTALDDKQDTLESGVNIKTINNQSILGEGDIEVGGGLPDSTNAKDGDTLRVKITPEEVAFLHPVETVTGGTTNDIFINTNATIDFSKFNFTDSVSGMPCEELIKLNFPAKLLVYGVNLGERLYKIYGDDNYMTDTNGTSIANICSSYWNLVNNQQTDNNGFYFVEVLSDASGSQSKSPLRLYKFDNKGSDVWVLIRNCESSMNYDSYSNYWFWSSDNFSITVDDNTINFVQGDTRGGSGRMGFDDDVQLAVNTSLFNNFLFVSPAFYFDIVAMNYDGAQTLITLMGMGGEDYDVNSEGFIWASASLEEGMEPGWSPDLEYAAGSHENGIISYLRGFLSQATSGGKSIPGEDDPVPNNITYVSDNPVVRDIFGSTRDTEVLSPEKKEIGWGLPFPDIKKAGQVLMTAGDEYALTYDNYQATHGVITAVDGFTFNTGLDQATVDANVITLGMRAMQGMKPIKATIMSPYMEYSVAFTTAAPLANFEVGQTIGENTGMFIDISKFSDMKAYLNNLGLTSGSPDYPLLVVDTSINALYATYDTDNSRVALMTSGGQEILNTDDESYAHEPFAELESGAKITNIYDGATWNGVFFYSLEESEDSKNGAILGRAKDITAETFTTEIMYSTVAGDAVIMNMLAQKTDMYMIVHNLEHRWYEENFNLLNFSGVCQFQISDRYRGGESIYGVLVTLQPGVFYGNIGNAHVEWGDASGKVNPEDYESYSGDSPQNVMVQAYQGDGENPLMRWSYSDMKSNISSYVREQLPAMPTYRYGDFTLYSGNWYSSGDGYKYQYSFNYSINDNDTLMIAPSSQSDATKAQEANVYFAEPTSSGSSQIYFYASEQPQNDISFKYTFIDLN